MNRTRSVLLTGAVLLLTCAWMGAGLWLVFDGIGHHHRARYLTGLAMVFPSSILVAGVAGVLIHWLVPGERERGRQYLERTRPSRSKNLLRRRERTIGRLKFLRRHPSAALAFIVVALVVAAAMLLAPATEGYPGHAPPLHILGALLLISYVAMFAGWLYLVITGRWEASIDASIRLIEQRQARMKERFAERDPGPQL